MSETRRQFEGDVVHAASHLSEPRMATIPEGWFSMGCENGRDYAKPDTRLLIARFSLGVYQVTRAEYACFLSETCRAAPPFWDEPNFQEPEQPVVGPSWFDAIAYCEWLSRPTGRNYRLPTEAEWERAACGGIEGQPYSWGTTPPEELPGYASRWRNGPEPVGLYAPNPYALFNMGDNVHEWGADWYDAHYYERSPERNPQGPQHGNRRPSRGVAWRHHAKVSRRAARSRIPPEFEYAAYRFRVPRSPR